VLLQETNTTAGKAGAKGAQQVYLDAAQTNELNIVN
jgi:hypothetical protein